MCVCVRSSKQPNYGIFLYLTRTGGLDTCTHTIFRVCFVYFLLHIRCDTILCYFVFRYRISLSTSIPILRNCFSCVLTFRDAIHNTMYAQCIPCMHYKIHCGNSMRINKNQNFFHHHRIRIKQPNWNDDYACTVTFPNMWLNKFLFRPFISLTK